MYRLTKEEIDTCRANALSAINGFIQHCSNAKPLSSTDFATIISILSYGWTRVEAKAKAMKFLRKATGMTKSTPWHVPAGDEDNNLHQYLVKNKLEYSGLPHEIPNLDLKNILYIIKFIQSNLHLLT